MRFCDKLPKLRKENNITQEQLADRLGVSRQAVSKWESGLSIPDMEKMIQLCNILNCTLDNLLDDGVVGEGKSETSKVSFTSYFQDFLKYISKIYNMFCSMKLKEILKCLLEMLLILGILYLAGLIIYNFLNQIFFSLLYHIPIIGEYLVLISKNIVLLALIILILIIFFHLFKIRYLDYYLIIEDKNTTEKTIEAPIAEHSKDLKEYLAPESKEKIIIRDPKHSTFSFFDFLSKMFTIVFKFFLLFILGIILVFFVFTIITFFMSIMHLAYNIFFFYLSLAILGTLLFTYIFIELIYFFVISERQHFKKTFVLGLISLILFGFGVGGSVITYLNFREYDVLNEGEIQKVNLKMEDNLMLEENNYSRMHFDYIIDDTKKDIEIEVKSYGDFAINSKEYIEQVNGNDYINYCLLFSRNPIDIYKLIVNNIRNKTRIPFLEDDVYSLKDLYIVKVTLSSENYQKLKNNYHNYLNDIKKVEE